MKYPMPTQLVRVADMQRPDVRQTRQVYSTFITPHKIEIMTIDTDGKQKLYARYNGGSRHWTAGGAEYQIEWDE